MKLQLTFTAVESYLGAPAHVRKAFDKQSMFLVQNLQHPSLQAKKYNDREGKWQARVNRSWRFYFTIMEDTYVVSDIIPHPK